MAIRGARVMIGALAEPEALLVFGAIVFATSKARRLDESGRPVSGTPYITPFGLEKKTSLPRDVIEEAARRLKRAGLLEVLVDEQRRYESWRVSEKALSARGGVIGVAGLGLLLPGPAQRVGLITDGMS